MTQLKRFSLQVVALAVFGFGLIWMSGNSVAVQSTDAEANNLYVKLQTGMAQIHDGLRADTLNIDASEKPGADISGEPDTRETIFKNIKLFNSMAYHIKNRYMEEIDAKDLIHAGIRGMLENLDPFSVLMEEKSYDRLMESTHGKYEGLGMQIDSRDDHIRIISPIEGTPAYRKGLQAGDVIWEINEQSTLNMNTQEAANLMRGTAGTSVDLKIKRTGVADLLEYEVERAVIELKSVNYYGYFPGTNIGYVRLSRFAEETGNELNEAITDLKSQKDLEGLIFDLRSNGGGLLHQAIETANLFLEKEKLVVYTRGRMPESERRYYSEHEPLMPEGKLVILVDEGTASASEIVSGAIQDWDRGIIMGEGTYGKGLVQQLFPAGGDHGVALKLTTAKYYIPSGRCIQRPERDYKHGSEAEAKADAEEEEGISDSMIVSDKEVFFTNGGRTVYGGGGILPDFDIERDRWYPIEMNLERQSMFFDFAVKYSVAHPEIDENFVVTDEILDEFKIFIEEKDFDYKTALEVSLDKMKEIVEDEDKQDLFTPSMDKLTSLVAQEKENDFKFSTDYFKRSIKREVISKLYGQRGMYEQIILKTDPAVKQALELIRSDKEYTRIIEGDESTAEL
ncbi:MAG: S41 family peptidase [FCB group bacterium]|nr:S41 family peptidase [FCB group bacterium]